MIGIRATNNNIYIFLEPEDILALQKNPVTGKYVNTDKDTTIAPLHLQVEPKLSDIITTDIDIEEGIIHQLYVRIRPLVLKKLQTNKVYGLHQGFRHIYLKDTSGLDLMENMIYSKITGKFNT